MKGTVKFFNAMKGFGFISGEDSKEYFVHQTGIKAGVTLRESDTVTFDVEQGDRGPKAVNVSRDAAGNKPSEGADEQESSDEEEESAESEE